MGSRAEELLKISQILEANKTKNFVDRILNRQKYPVLDLGNGNIATHKMAWEGNDKSGYYVYPTVIQGEDGTLKELSPQDAINYSREKGEFIKFDNSDDADWFSKNYKKIWGQ